MDKMMMSSQSAVQDDDDELEDKPDEKDMFKLAFANPEPEDEKEEEQDEYDDEEERTNRSVGGRKFKKPDETEEERQVIQKRNAIAYGKTKGR